MLQRQVPGKKEGEGYMYLSRPLLSFFSGLIRSEATGGSTSTNSKKKKQAVAMQKYYC